jgi:hypothetical protein
LLEENRQRRKPHQSPSRRAVFAGTMFGRARLRRERCCRGW